ncbi:MAG TPA: LacI family DNA-binding transcriptional regulator [Candidatus Methylomirabilis sp.]|nr:LacI family DNA-binding transcriptional regulator [Candidatus Methylomirabilis sp.]HSC70185.1 LacI family DNA-binding transcriptional regulator [Candidatus Methylomirabilis sp.]
MPSRSPKVTRLQDVARLADVSTATVSRVLNNQGPISELARTRVLRAARELDYHPNWLAKSLRSRHTDTIGLVVPDIENPFFTALVKGVEREASARGWNVVLGNSDEDIWREESLVRTLVERRIDGLVVCPAAGSHAYLVPHVNRRLPIVTVNRALREFTIPAVTSDNEQGAYEAARHLLAEGRHPLALILGTPGLSTTEARLAGCRRATRELGLGPQALRITIGHGRTAQGYKAALECLEGMPRPRAILAFNNLMAESALMAIHAVGLRCPEEVALIGFDDFRSAAALSPPLSVVEQDPVGMGARAVEVLAQVIGSGQPAEAASILPTRLVIRASCGCAPTPG